MAELADAHGSGPCGSNTMRVQVSFPALHKNTSEWITVLKCFFIINYLASAAKNKAFGYFLSESLMYSAGKRLNSHGIATTRT